MGLSHTSSLVIVNIKILSKAALSTHHNPVGCIARHIHIPVVGIVPNFVKICSGYWIVFQLWVSKDYILQLPKKCPNN